MAVKEELLKYLSSPEAQAALNDYRQAEINAAVTRQKEAEKYQAAIREYGVRQRLGPDKALLTPQEQEFYKPFKEFSSLNPVYQGQMGNVYNTEDINKMLSGYSALDVSKLGDDPLSQSMKSRMTMAGDVGYLPTSQVEYYQKLADLADKQMLNYYGFGGVVDPYEKASYNWRYTSKPAFSVSFDGKSGIYIPAELTNTIYGTNPWADVLGNEDIYKYGKLAYLPEDVAKGISNSLKGYKDANYDLKNPEIGYFMSQKEFDDYVTAKFNSGFDEFRLPSTISTGHGTHDLSNLVGSKLYRMEDNIWDQLSLQGAQNPGELQSSLTKAAGARPSWFAQSANDPKLFFGMSPNQAGAASYDTYTKTIDTRNWAAKALGKLGPLASIMSFIPPLAPIGMGLSAGMSIGTGLKTGNLGKVAAGVLSIPGVGTGVTSSLTKAYAPTFGAAAPHLAAGTISGGLGALSGNDPLRSALAGGAGSYAGATLSSGLKGTNPALANAAGKAVGGLTAQSIMGQPINSTNALRSMLISTIQQSMRRQPQQTTLNGSRYNVTSVKG